MQATSEEILILDFGSQYTQLIGRRIRETHVYSEILPFYTPIEELRKRNPKGIILSGGPSSVYEDDAPSLDPALFEMEITCSRRVLRNAAHRQGSRWTDRAG